MSPKPSSKTDLVKLEDIEASNSSGYKTSFLNCLDIARDDYSGCNYTPEEARIIKSHLSRLTTGASAAIPLYCGLQKCPFSFQCPIALIEKERADVNPSYTSPILGKRCRFEVDILNGYTKYYIHEYDIDENSVTEIHMVRELAEIEVMLIRLNHNLAKPENAELVQEVTVGVDKLGNTLTRQEMNAFIETKERLNNRKSKLIKLMVGDRQEKYKREAALKIKDEGDYSTSAAQLRSKVTRMLQQVQQDVTLLQEKEGNLIDVEASPATPSPLTPEDLISESEE